MDYGLNPFRSTGHLCDPKHPPITEIEAAIYLARDLQIALGSQFVSIRYTERLDQAGSAYWPHARSCHSPCSEGLLGIVTNWANTCVSDCALEWTSATSLPSRHSLEPWDQFNCGSEEANQ